MTGPDAAREAAHKEFMVKSAYLFLVYRLRAFGLTKQSAAIQILADHPGLRETAAESISSLDALFLPEGP